MKPTVALSFAVGCLASLQDSIPSSGIDPGFDLGTDAASMSAEREAGGDAALGSRGLRLLGQAGHVDGARQERVAATLADTEALAGRALKACASGEQEADVWLCNEAVRETILETPGWAKFSKTLKRSIPQLEKASTDDAASPKVVIVQFHTQKPGPNATFDPLPPLLNKLYFERFAGHKFIFYHMAEEDQGALASNASLLEDCDGSDRKVRKHHMPLINLKGCFLYPTWGKLMAMKAAAEEYPDAKYFLFTDNDAVINEFLYDYPLSVDGYYDWLEDACGALDSTPFLIAQEVEFWRAMVQRSTSVNTGTLLMKNTAAAREALGVWLDTALDPYGNTDLLRSDKDPERRGIRFRTNWPHEQFTLNRLVTEPAYHNGVGAAMRTVPGAKDLLLAVSFQRPGAAQNSQSCDALPAASDAGSVESFLRARGWIPTNVEQGSLRDHVLDNIGFTAPDTEGAGCKFMIRQDDPDFTKHLCQLMSGVFDAGAGFHDNRRWRCDHCSPSACRDEYMPRTIKAIQEGTAKVEILGQPQVAHPFCNLQCMKIHGNGFSRQKQCLIKHWANHKDNLSSFSKTWLVEKFAVRSDHHDAMLELAKSAKPLHYPWKRF